MTTIRIYKSERFDSRLVAKKRRGHGRRRGAPKRWKLRAVTYAHVAILDGTIPTCGTVRDGWQQVVRSGESGGAT